MKTKTFALSCFLLAATISAGVSAGEILTNKAGMTLYTFDKDSKGESVCYGPCAAKWPPYIAAQDAKAKKSWGLITRKDGSKQWTFKGQPLYTWVGDTKVGDTNGDGVGGVWHTAKKTSTKTSYYKQNNDYSYDSAY